MKENNKKDKIEILFNRLNHILSITALELDMTIGEVELAIVKLLDSEMNNGN